MIKLITFCLLLSGVSLKNTEDCFKTEEQKCLALTPKGFNYLKTFPLSTEQGKYLELSYVFTRSTTYSMTICCQSIKGTSIEIFSSNRKIISSAMLSDQLFSLNLKCAGTGIYYIRLTPATNINCGVFQLSFSR